MKTPENDSREWGKGRCMVLTGAMCAVALGPLLLSQTVVGLVALAILILIYYGLLRIFGDGFVIEGAIIVLIMAVLTMLMMPAVTQTREGSNPQEHALTACGPAPRRDAHSGSPPATAAMSPPAGAGQLPDGDADHHHLLRRARPCLRILPLRCQEGALHRAPPGGAG